MACCNNECLEPVYTDCIEHTGPLNNLPSNLGEIIPILDTLLEGESNENINLDLKCLSSNCADPIVYNYTYVKPTSGSGNALIKINLATPITGIATVKAIYSGTIISSINNLDDFLIVPLSYANLGFTVTVELITTAPFYGTFYVPSSMGSGVVNNLELLCQGNGVVQISKLAFYNLIIDEICKLKAE